MKIYGIFTSLLAVIFGALSIPILPAPGVYGDVALAIGFVVTLAVFAPTIGTLGALGLMDDEDSRFEDGKENRKLVASVYPGIFWPVGAITGVCLVAWCFHSVIHPLYVFYSAVCSFSAYWALYVYPKAKRLLEAK
jgi:hypothetical protein